MSDRSIDFHENSSHYLRLSSAQYSLTMNCSLKHHYFICLCVENPSVSELFYRCDNLVKLYRGHMSLYVLRNPRASSFFPGRPRSRDVPIAHARENLHYLISPSDKHGLQMKWCSRPRFCTVRLNWAGGYLGLCDVFCYELCPW